MRTESTGRVTTGATTGLKKRPEGGRGLDFREPEDGVAPDGTEDEPMGVSVPPGAQGPGPVRVGGREEAPD